jgi:hypothetical protein
MIYGKERLIKTKVKMIEIMQLMSEGEHGSAVALTRVSVLSTYLPEAQIPTI